MWSFEKRKQRNTTAYVTSYLPSTYLTNILNNALFCVTTPHSRTTPKFHKIVKKCIAMQALGLASRLIPLFIHPVFGSWRSECGAEIAGSGRAWFRGTSDLEENEAVADRYF
jgi:hypothetical protein